MAGLNSWVIDEVERVSPRGMQPHQIKAVAAPYLPFRRLIEDETGSISPGNFQDLESLLDQLASPPVFELGKPPIKKKFMPKPRVGSCPASHNRALLDEDER